MLDCLAIGAGGFIGSILRYLIGLLPLSPQSGFPVKTFAINIIGSFIIGIVAAAAADSSISLNPRLVLFLKVGICGGFTTFSSFALETDQLIAKGSYTTALLYMSLSIILGVAAAYTGEKLILH